MYIWNDNDREGGRVGGDESTHIKFKYVGFWPFVREGRLLCHARVIQHCLRPLKATFVTGCQATTFSNENIYRTYLKHFVCQRNEPI